MEDVSRDHEPSSEFDAPRYHRREKARVSRRRCRQGDHFDWISLPERWQQLRRAAGDRSNVRFIQPQIGSWSAVWLACLASPASDRNKSETHRRPNHGASTLAIPAAPPRGIHDNCKIRETGRRHQKCVSSGRSERDVLLTRRLNSFRFKPVPDDMTPDTTFKSLSFGKSLDSSSIV
jgi:hypothetical protein